MRIKKELDYTSEASNSPTLGNSFFKLRSIIIFRTKT